MPEFVRRFKPPGCAAGALAPLQGARFKSTHPVVVHPSSPERRTGYRLATLRVGGDKMAGLQGGFQPRQAKGTEDVHRAQDLVFHESSAPFDGGANEMGGRFDGAWVVEEIGTSRSAVRRREAKPTGSRRYSRQGCLRYIGGRGPRVMASCKAVLAAL